MPPFLILPLLLVGAGGIIYFIRRSAGASAMDFAAADAHQPPSTEPPKQPTGSGQTGSQTGSGQQPSITRGEPSPSGLTGQTVLTPPTATEPTPLTIPLAMPSTQPRMPTAENLEAARAYAPGLDAVIKANPDGKEFVRKLASGQRRGQVLFDMVKRFQGLANIEPQDGYYGPVTAGALMYFLGGGQPPPAPFVYEAGSQRVIKIYQPRP
jgi:hypothetical protein